MAGAVSDPPEVPGPPQRTLAQRAPDMLVWGAVIVLLIVGFKPVDMGHFTRLFTNSENMRQFGAELLKPDFTDWKLYVAQMWLTVQIAMWGTFLGGIVGGISGTAVLPIAGSLVGAFAGTQRLDRGLARGAGTVAQ